MTKLSKQTDLQASIGSDHVNDHRCGSIAIVGRPNVGKSTLLNAIIGQKVSITSRKPQTTRHRIAGILSTGDCQFVFIDTPGFQTKYRNHLNRTLNRTVTNTVVGVDLIAFVVEADSFSEEDKQVLALLPTQLPTLAIINKIDQIKDKALLLPFLQTISAEHDFAEIIPISAKSRDDIATLLPLFRQYLPVSEPMHDAELFTDRSERFLAAEVIREKIFRLTGDELPYTSTVIVEKFEQKGRLRRIFASILIDQTRHKMMVIGAKGAKLKQIGTDARLSLESLFGEPVYLELFVKVKTGWADKEATLRSYGYE